MPAVQELGLNRLKKTCDNVILSFLQARKEASLSETLEFLVLAEKYSLKSVRQYCIDECSAHFSGAKRKQLIDDRHVQEKTKIEILDKMLDNMSNEYETNLKQIRHDMDRRCRAIEKRRDEFMEQTETWKTELDGKVASVTQSIHEDHKQLQVDAYQQEIFKDLNDSMTQFNVEIGMELEALKQELNIITDSIRDILNNKETEKAEKSEKAEKTEKVEETEETKEDDELNKANKILDSLEQLLEKTADNASFHQSCLEASFRVRLSTCGFPMRFQTILKENVETFEKIEQLTLQLDEKTKKLTELEVKNAEQIVRQEKTECELRKFAKQCHDINTWLKWAKPDSDSFGRCTCFRHACTMRMSIEA